MTILVTGAFGLVGSAVLTRLREDGAEVVATDVDTPAARRAAQAFPGLRVEWVDLTDRPAVGDLLSRVAPDVVVHLAAVIPPQCHARPGLARRVNVGGTEALVRAAEAMSVPPRLVHASSVAVHGARNPHRVSDLLGAETPLAPTDLYGRHKAEAEQLVRASSLDWVVLRLGGVMTVAPSSGLDLDQVYFGALLPTDGRIQTVDVRDVARAFAAAASAPVVGEVLMIGGDGTHRLRQGDITPAMTAAVGLDGGIPVGRPGDPERDDAWFATDWMDTARAQEALGFQHHSWPAMLAEVRAGAGWQRFLLRLAAPVVHEVLRRRASPYTSTPGAYADPAAAIEARWGRDAVSAD